MFAPWSPRLLAALAFLALASVASAEPLVVEVQDAKVEAPAGAGLPVMTITLTPDGRLAFGRFTAEHVGHRVEVRIDGKAVMRPIVREPILRGVLQISGPPLEELRELAKRLSAGNVKLEVEVAAE